MNINTSMGKKPSIDEMMNGARGELEYQSKMRDNVEADEQASNDKYKDLDEDQYTDSDEAKEAWRYNAQMRKEGVPRKRAALEYLDTRYEIYRPWITLVEIERFISKIGKSIFPEAEVFQAFEKTFMETFARRGLRGLMGLPPADARSKAQITDDAPWFNSKLIKPIIEAIDALNLAKQELWEGRGNVEFYKLGLAVNKLSVATKPERCSRIHF